MYHKLINFVSSIFPSSSRPDALTLLLVNFSIHLYSRYFFSWIPVFSPSSVFQFLWVFATFSSSCFPLFFKVFFWFILTLHFLCLIIMIFFEYLNGYGYQIWLVFIFFKKTLKNLKTNLLSRTIYQQAGTYSTLTDVNKNSTAK